MIDPISAGRDDIALFVRDLTDRPSFRPRSVAEHGAPSFPRLSNATVQQRLTAVRLFYDFLVEEGLRISSPIGRGRYAPGGRAGVSRRGLMPRFTHLPWIPDDEAWDAILTVASREPIRNRTMLALAYDAALRREELCSLRTDDIDPARRTIRVRAETTKGRRERVVPYSAPGGELLRAYLAHRSTLSRARGPLFLSESPRNWAEPLTLWTWSKVIRRIALEAGEPRFSTHTLRHLCLTDLARAGWELHAIATFAGHRSPDTTLQYIHLSGRELAAKLASGMAQIHDWRIALLAATAAGSA
ncbi:site-specific integrase [Phyllobacterium sophorae]|uniref:tyrosine-type recombinase/integrase n=1 Tax=Phyllobacterium sophorae TaxID=1520277 RepID=UPI00315A2542